MLPVWETIAMLNRKRREDASPSVARGSSAARRLIIAASRTSQPLPELRRKAAKAKNRANLWTVEELDLAAAEARRMADALGW